MTNARAQDKQRIDFLTHQNELLKLEIEEKVAFSYNLVFSKELSNKGTYMHQIA